MISRADDGADETWRAFRWKRLMILEFWIRTVSKAGAFGPSFSLLADTNIQTEEPRRQLEASLA